MTISPAPICVDCIHFKETKGLPCDAFPKGIPDEILIGGFDHHKPFKGDNGIRFKKKEEQNK